ncbi:DUF2321 domain-containing protein [Paenibacillus sp. sgz5001063]|uniref:DUF2321 domain-containing protein n=1 Tax=Paenibacillus sp. sgz5001063 TaxID=3242474 RepID=UPI0036D3CE2D
MDIQNIGGSEHFDIAQVCLNGHVINDHFQDSPHLSKKFCTACGESTVISCSECNTPIQGKSRASFSYASKYTLPRFCHHCGHSYPWIARKLNAAGDLADLVDELSPIERERLSTDFLDLVKDSPSSQVAALRIKRAFTKVTPNIQEAFKDILISVISAPITKFIWG